MSKVDRLIKLKYIHINNKLKAECLAIGIELKDHPEIEALQKLHIQLKKVDKKWLNEYLKLKG